MINLHVFKNPINNLVERTEFSSEQIKNLLITLKQYDPEELRSNFSSLMNLLALLALDDESDKHKRIGSSFSARDYQNFLWFIKDITDVFGNNFNPEN